jgi:hypothetical protein
VIHITLAEPGVDPAEVAFAIGANGRPIEMRAIVPPHLTP